MLEAGESAPRRLWRDECGSSTIEFVLWLPLFAFLLMLTANASFVYLDLTRMENAARDGVRRISIGHDTGTVATDVAAQLPEADYSIDTSCTTAEIACIAISRSTDSMLPFTSFLGVGNLLGRTFGSEIRMRKEPGVSQSDMPGRAGPVPA